MQIDEARSVALVCKGDQRAYLELVERYLPAIEVYVKRVVNDKSGARHCSGCDGGALTTFG